MSAFTPAEIEYMTTRRLGRLATVGPDGQPHLAPVTYVYNAAEDSIDIGGMRFGRTKWRDAKANPKICFLVDESADGRGGGIEIRGEAELHETGGETINCIPVAALAGTCGGAYIGRETKSWPGNPRTGEMSS
jgi:PPOX class F420-dependent enzyme/OxyR family protein